jgi:hypothetical protein
MSARVIFTQPAPEGELFDQGAFDDQIDKQLPVTMNGASIGIGLVVDAAVRWDGRAVQFTIAFDEAILELAPRLTGVSVDSDDP